MHRRDFLKHASAVSAGTATLPAFAAPAIAQNRRRLRLVTTWPKDFPGLGTGAARLARRITDMTDGRVTVKVFAAGELVPAFEAFDAVAGGTADLYHAADYYWQGKSMGFPFFTTVPYGLTAQEMAAWIYHGGGQALWDELSGQFGIKPFLAGNSGVQMAGWFRQPVDSLEDLKGLKFRAPGLGGEVLRRVGVSVVNMPGGEIFPALQAGAIDGAEWVGPWNDLAFGFHKITKHYYYPGFHEPGTAASCGINRKVWDSLTASDRAAIASACTAETNYTLAEFNARNAGALETLIHEHGVKLHKFNDRILAALGEAAGEVVAEAATESGLTRRIYESYMEFRRKAVSWSRIAGQAYLGARRLPVPYGQ